MMKKRSDVVFFVVKTVERMKNDGKRNAF